jgi:hypothetical protein
MRVGALISPCGNEVRNTKGNWAVIGDGAVFKMGIKGE